MQRGNPGQLTDVVVFGAGGQFGRLFIRRFIDAGMRVHGIDVTGDERIVRRNDEADVIRRVQSADAVLLCIPEQHILAELPFLARHMRPGSVLIDIASVKSEVTAAAAGALSATGIEYLSIHPMFGPTLDFAGGNMVFIGAVDTPRAAAFKTLVQSWHVTPHTMSAAQHDEATQITQVACHAAVIAFASVAAASGLDLATIQKVETPVSRAIFALAARILSGDPALYFAIQRNHGAAARDALSEALMTERDEASWNARFNATAAFFADQIDAYAGVANEMLKASVPPSEPAADSD